MSVIIRLQNLPWSANALDVRNFFKGLSIPDGGVHIVGGEMGDAFIAFSTDEDARQAMMMNGGKIKEVQVTLLLSSRAEMQKVIEDARRTTMSFMQLSAQAAPAIPQQAPVIPKVSAPAVSGAQPQPPVISLSGFLAQNLSQQKNQSLYSEIPGLGFLATSGGMFQPNAPAAGLFSALSGQNYSAGSPTNSAFTQLSEQLKKVGEADKTGGLAKVSGSTTNSSSVSKKDSGERSSRRSRSSSRERDRRRSSRDRSRSRSRDRGSRRRGRDRSRSRDRRSRSRSRDRRDRRRRSRSRDRRDDRARDKTRDGDQKSSDKNSKSRGSRFSDRGDSKSTPAEVAKIQSPKATPNVLQPTTFTSPWDAPIQQSLMKLANPDMEKPVQQNAIPSIMSPTQSTSEDGFGDRNDQGLKSVPAVQNPIVSYRMNVMPAVNYGSFQSSKPLSNEQLSKLQQLQSRRDSKIFQGPPNMGGNRQGGHFSDGESNTFAKNNNRGGFDLAPRREVGANRPGDGYSTDGGVNKRNQSMEERSDGHDDVEGQSVKVSNLENATGYGEVRRFFHGQTISSNGIKMINDKNGRRTGVAMIRFLRKDGKRYALSRDGMRLRHSVVKIESITDQEFEEAVDSYRPGYEEVPNNWKEVSPDRKENKREEVIEIRDDEQDVKQGSVVVWSLPSMTTELDLMRIFSDFTVVEVLIIKNYKNPKQLDGYVKFHRVQDAVRACDSTHKHYVRNKRVFVKQCSDIEYDAAKNEYEAPHEPEPVTVDLDDSVQIVNETSKDSKKDEKNDDDDKMDLAEDEEEDNENAQLGGDVNAPIQPIQQKPVENQFGSPPPNMASGMTNNEPPMNRGYPSNQPFAGMQNIVRQEENWEPEQFRQNAPPMNRDPRGMFNQNFNQEYQQEQQLRQQQQPQSMPQLNLGFGGDMNRDPRRRQDGMMNQMQQSGFDQGPPPSMGNNNRFGPQDMGPMGGNNRFDQQQQQQMDNNQGRPFGSNRYDQQMGFNQGPPMGGNRFDQPMGHNQDGPPMGNNRYQQQQQMSNAPGGQFGNNQFNRNNNGRQNANDDKTTFIMITNLEYAMQESNIFEFFDQEGFSPKHVHILRNKNGRSMGECLVEFQSSQEAEETLSKHGQVIGKRRAFIKHLNRNQIMDIMQRINQNGPGLRNQMGGQFGGNNNFNNNNNNFRRGDNFGGNNFGNSNNNFKGNNQNDRDNGGFQKNDDRFNNDNRNFDERNSQGNNNQTYSDDHFYDEDPQEDFESHEDQETHGDQDNYSKDNAEPTEVEKMPEKQSDDVTESDQHNENPEEDHDKVELEPVEHGPDDDDPPLKQPNDEYLHPCEEEEEYHHNEEQGDEEPEDDEHEGSGNQNGLEPQQQEQQQEQQQQPQQEEQQSQHQENEETEHTDQEHHESDNMHDENQPEPIRGNILCLGNLPFRAPNEELVGYFREYNITIEDVKRRYLPDGRPTGDAMVRFQSGMDAQRAMQTHYNRRIGGRQVRMRILED